MSTTTSNPGVTIPDELRGSVFTTFTHPCAFGCIVQVIDTQEQPHVCVGTEVVLAVAPELTTEQAQRITAALAPLVRTLRASEWAEAGRILPAITGVVHVDDVEALVRMTNTDPDLGGIEYEPADEQA